MSANALDIARLYTDLDLPVDPTGTIRVSASGDAALLQGQDNLLRAIARRIAVSPGELVYRPSYGCGALLYIGAANSPAQRAKLARAIRVGLLADPRLKDVSVSVAVGTATDSADSTALTVTMTLTLRDGTTSPLSLTLSR